MKKLMKAALLITLLLSFMGCSHIILRKDLYEKTSFKNEKIKPGRNTIKIYSLEYPVAYRDRLDYMDDFEEVSKKLLLENKSMNLLVSREMYETIQRIKNQEFLPEEEVYLKTASDLDDVQKEIIDSYVNLSVTDLGGDIQKYLNKQVYFWLALNYRESEFNGDTLYTELDKQRLIEEVREERKDFSQILSKVKVNFILKEYDLYSEKDKRHGVSKEIDLFNPTEMPREILNEKNALYIKGMKDEDLDKIIKNMVNFASPLMILESEEFTGYSVKEGKYIFFHGGNNVMGYYHGYDFRIDIIDIDVENLPDAEDCILLENLFERVKPEMNSLETEENKIQKKTVNWVVD